MQDLEGKVVVVTGAASGIGLAYSKAFAHAGMRVVLADIELDALEGAAQEVGAIGVEVHAVPTDVTDATAVDELASQAVGRFGAVHVVCNNAGVGGTPGASWEVPLAAWRWVLDVNLSGVVHGVRTFVPRFIAQGEGHVVNTASIAAYASIPFMATYCASKHAVLALSEALHHELAMFGPGVGVTVVCPAFVNTRIAESERNWPTGRLGPAPDVDAGTVAMLQELIAGGIDPSEVASLVVDAVRANQFQVTTGAHIIEHMLSSRGQYLSGAAPAMPPLT